MATPHPLHYERYELPELFDPTADDDEELQADRRALLSRPRRFDVSPGPLRRRAFAEK
jgi:hypothetical protein